MWLYTLGQEAKKHAKTIGVDTIISILILNANYLFIHCETLDSFRGLQRSLYFLIGTTAIKYMASVVILKYNSGWRIIERDIYVAQIKMYRIHLLDIPPPLPDMCHKLHSWRSFQAMGISGLLRRTFCFFFEGNGLYLVSPQPCAKGEKWLQVEGLNHKVSLILAQYSTCLERKVHFSKT